MAKNNIRKTGGQSWEHGSGKVNSNNIVPFKRANLKNQFKKGYG